MSCTATTACSACSVPGPATSAGTETWIVENVSAGGFGAGIPEIKGDWLKIGCLLGLQPEGGDNWVLGVIRRLQREIPLKGSVGIQTIARSAELVQLSVSGGAGGETGILISDGSEPPGEARVLLRAGAFVPGAEHGIPRRARRPACSCPRAWSRAAKSTRWSGFAKWYARPSSEE